MVPKSCSIFMSSTDVGGPPVCEHFHLGPRWTALSRCQNAFSLGCDGRTQPHKLDGQTWYDKSSSPPAENGREVAYQQNPTEKIIVLILSLESFASKLLRGPGPTQEMVGNWPTRARPEPRLQNDVVRHVTGLFEPPVCLWFCMCFCLFRDDLKFFDSFWNSLYSVELPCQSQHLMVTSRWVEAVEASN